MMRGALCVVISQAIFWLIADAQKVRGVSSEDQSLYKADKNNKWRCLSNPEIEIDISKVNDDYCDCPDGSDEPGTSACGQGRFYCENVGYKSSYIPSFKVNDGVCDYEVCCDGTDEWNTGVECKNRCRELNQKYEELRKQKLSNLVKGLKIKARFIETVEKYNSDLNAQIADESVQVSKLNDQVYRLKTDLDALNLKNNKEATLFLKDLDGKYNASLIAQGIDKYVESIKLIRLGVDENDKKIDVAKQLLNTLSTDFDQSINDLTVKKAIKDYEEFANDDKYRDYSDLSSEYVKQYDAYLRDLGLYTPNLYLEQNKEHLVNWKNFFWTRKTTLHTSLLKLLLIQDDATKRLEAILEDVEKNYNPNFNNDVVKTCLKSIEAYNELKKTVQDQVLSKIDYVNDYDGAAKKLINEIESLEKNLSRNPVPLKDLKIDDEHSQAELDVLRDAKRAELSETETVSNKRFWDRLHHHYVSLIEDFLGIHDNVPEKIDPVFDSVPYDLVANKIELIKDLSSGTESTAYGKESKRIRDEIARKQEEIAHLNQHVADLLEELKSTKYGPDKILKAVENETYKAPIGEYEYSINFLGEIRQTGNGQNVLVGTYNGEAYETTNPKDGSKKLELVFKNGAKCWSGPIRQAKVDVYCGEKVEILKVTEPEVCLYYIDITSPLACFKEELENMDSKNSRNVHDEL